jgi:hypothetical protein
MHKSLEDPELTSVLMPNALVIRRTSRYAPPFPFFRPVVPVIMYGPARNSTYMAARVGCDLPSRIGVLDNQDNVLYDIGSENTCGGWKISLEARNIIFGLVGTHGRSKQAFLTAWHRVRPQTPSPSSTTKPLLAICFRHRTSTTRCCGRRGDLRTSNRNNAILRSRQSIALPARQSPSPPSPNDQISSLNLTASLRIRPRWVCR